MNAAQAIPTETVVREALRVKGRRYPRYERDDYTQDVLLYLLMAKPYDPTRGSQALYVRVVARSVLRAWVRRRTRRASIEQRGRNGSKQPETV